MIVTRRMRRRANTDEITKLTGYKSVSNSVSRGVWRASNEQVIAWYIPVKVKNRVKLGDGFIVSPRRQQ